VPGGFCNPGEHPVETARREILEETGIAVRVIGFLGMWLDVYGETAGLAKRTLNIYYHAIPEGIVSAVTDPEEITDEGWFRPNHLPTDLAFPEHIPWALRAWRAALDHRFLATPLFDYDQQYR
jgi:8-oxo-dGTP pyrophosphatase MutT (NUDIX family)